MNDLVTIYSISFEENNHKIFLSSVEKVKKLLLKDTQLLDKLIRQKVYILPVLVLRDSEIHKRSQLFLSL